MTSNLLVHSINITKLSTNLFIVYMRYLKLNIQTNISNLKFNIRSNKKNALIVHVLNKTNKQTWISFIHSVGQLVSVIFKFFLQKACCCFFRWFASTLLFSLYIFVDYGHGQFQTGTGTKGHSGNSKYKWRVQQFSSIIDMPNPNTY